MNETDLCVDLCGPSIEMTDGGDHESDCVWADGGDRASVNGSAPSHTQVETKECAQCRV